VIGTRPGWWHNPALCVWDFHDCRGRRVARITDEAYFRARVSPRDLVLATS
jgi:hypothetical protein